MASQFSEVALAQNDTEVRQSKIPLECAGLRLDQALAHLWTDYSRAQLQQWLKMGCIQVAGQSAKASSRVTGGETVSATFPTLTALDDQPEALALDLLWQDDDIFVINKPAGLIAHPGAGNPTGTLVNALLHLDASLAQLPRAGLIHRLDKDTSGLLLVARNPLTYQRLVQQMQQRAIHRQYRALVQGELTGGGTVDAPMGRHPQDRLRQAVITGGRTAVTHYRLYKRFNGLTELLIELETGRTHQIRVHMAHIRHPVVGDPLYGTRRRLPAGLDESQRRELNQFSRQALHAWRLRFVHPRTQETVAIEAPLPTDLAHLLATLAT